MPLVDRFHLAGDGPQPAADRVIYADGSADAGFRPGADIELSHWIPNTTPERWKADSSTGICFRFADDPEPGTDLAVNNHADVDGTLSLFVLTHTELALDHRDALVNAAEQGDFRAWPTSRLAFRIAQEIELFLEVHGDEPLRRQYEAVFALVTAILDGSGAEHPAVEPAWRAVNESATLLDDGMVTVAEASGRFATFVHPPASPAAVAARLHVHQMGVAPDDPWVLPHGRNRDHAERVKLVSNPAEGGWFHDLWYPDYSWAETPDRWTPPGLDGTDSSNVLAIDHQPLRAAIERLDAMDTASGQWALSATLTPFQALAGRAFPVVASHVDERDEPTPSSLEPATVAAELAGLWD